MSAELRHGDASTYGNYGCRCRPCRDAWAARSREYNSAKRHRRDELRAKRALKRARMRAAQLKAINAYRQRLEGNTNARR